MSERASALGGTLALSSAPGGGTMVTIKTRLAPRTSAQQAASHKTAQEEE
jgi:nitrate/nitrite-specific signal transduction histidine kinase